MPSVNPEILQWARETAGLTLEQAADKVDVNPANGMSGEERLAEYESGDREPSRPLLRRMAKQYRRPLMVFYMSRVPRAGDRGHDFRTLPQEHSRADDALVDALVRDVRARQEIVKALLLDDEEKATPLEFVGSMNTEAGAEAVANLISQTLDLDLAQYRDRRFGGFDYLRSRTEEAGIYVLLIGNLGSYHTNIDVELFRGFAIADPIAPFVVVNDNDAEAAWSFSLLHEICHVWLGATGVSGVDPASPIEQFCNDVAARLLLPQGDRQELLGLRQYRLDELINEVDDLARRWQVSRSMVTYALFRQGVIDKDLWRQLSGIFRQRWVEAREARRDRNREAEGGPNYYVVRKHRLGDAILRLAERTMAEGTLSPTKASKLLGVKPSNVYRLMDGGVASPPERAV